LVVNFARTGTRNLANLYGAVLYAAKMGHKGTLALWTFGRPYKTPGADPDT